MFNYAIYFLQKTVKQSINYYFILINLLIKSGNLHGFFVGLLIVNMVYQNTKTSFVLLDYYVIIFVKKIFFYSQSQLFFVKLLNYLNWII